MGGDHADRGERRLVGPDRIVVVVLAVADREVMRLAPEEGQRRTLIRPRGPRGHLLPQAGEGGHARSVSTRFGGLSVSAFDVRVKAGAFAPPLTRLTALTRPPDADSVPPCNRRFPLNSGMGFQLLPPRFAVAQNGVEDGEQFARYGDQCDHFLFPGGDEALVEGLERAIMLD